MKIEIELSELNEGTESPWWIIIDPRQNFEVDDQGVCSIAHMITGPFFSRKEAEDFLSKTRYNFGKHPVVWCHSGYYSEQYKNAIRKATLPKEVSNGK